MKEQNIRIILGANSAAVEPPLGPMLGQYGLNARDFVKAYNDLTKDYLKGLLLNIIVIVGKDRKFEIIIKGVCMYELINHIVGNSGYIYKSELYNLALLQHKFRKDISVYSLFKSLCSTVISMKYKIING